jgi:hypothetical protein
MVLERITSPGYPHFGFAEQLAPHHLGGRAVRGERDTSDRPVRLPDVRVPLVGFDAAALAVFGERRFDRLAAIVSESGEPFALAFDDLRIRWYRAGVLLLEQFRHGSPAFRFTRSAVAAPK